MRSFRFWHVDAFSAEPYKGNPAAMIFEADKLTLDEMQTIARQFNLSETVFLCPPSAGSGADYRARIFTPSQEIPFAGHPTIASAFTYASTRREDGVIEKAELRQECGAGIIPVSVTLGDGPLFTLSAEAGPTVGTGLDTSTLARMLGCRVRDIADDPVEVCSIGLPWMIARVASLAALEAAKPDQGAIEAICREHGAVGITVYAEGAVLDGCSFHVRTFAPGDGIPEDPVCGSGNGAVAVHLARHLYRDRAEFAYRAEQGLEVHRRGILHLSVTRRADADSMTVRLGGQAVRVLEGRLRI